MFITPESLRLQTGTHSASVEKREQLQSAAHTFYQQVVRVFKQRALVERERPGLFFSLVFNGMVMLSFKPTYITFLLIYILIYSYLFFCFYQLPVFSCNVIDIILCQTQVHASTFF